MLSEKSSSFIRDQRRDTDFKHGTTFSGFRFTDVRGQFVTSLKTSNPDKACYWAVELMCTGKFIELFDAIILGFCKFIHVGNPKYVLLIQDRYRLFKSITQSASSSNAMVAYSIMDFRNHQDVRALFTDLTYMLATEPKHPTIERVNVPIHTDSFETMFVLSKLKAPSTKFARGVVKPRDPKEFTMAINEFCYHVQTSHPLDACFWMEWMFAYDAYCVRQKQKMTFHERQFIHGEIINAKYARELVWLIWEALFRCLCGPRFPLFHGEEDDDDDDDDEEYKDAGEGKGKKEQSSRPPPPPQRSMFSNPMPLMERILVDTLRLFMYDFKKGEIKKRKGLLYFTITMLCQYFRDPAAVNESSQYPTLQRDHEMREHVIEGVHTYFRDMKSRETLSVIDMAFDLSEMDELDF